MSERFVLIGNDKYENLVERLTVIAKDQPLETYALSAETFERTKLKEVQWLVLDLKIETKQSLLNALLVWLKKLPPESFLVVCHAWTPDQPAYAFLSECKADLYCCKPLDPLSFDSQIRLLDARHDTRLLESEKRFRLLFENAPIAYQSLDADKKIIDVNLAWQEMTGYSRDEALGKKMQDFMPDDQAPLLSQRFKQFVDEGSVCALQFELISKSSATIVVSVEGRIGKDKQGNFLQTHCILHNITEKVAREKALRNSEEKFRMLAEHIPGAIYICTPEAPYKMLYLNDQIEAITGYPKAYYLEENNPFSTCIHQDDRKRVYRDIQETLKHNSKYSIQYRIHRRNGHLCWVEDVGQGVLDEQGRVMHLEGFIFDITERKNTRDALLASENLLRNVLDTVPVRVFYKDKELRYLGCNIPFALDAGLSDPEDIIGRDDYQMSWLHEAELYRTDDLAVIQSGVSKMDYEEPQTNHKGEVKWLRTSKVPLKDPNGTIIGVLGTYQDITAYKNTQRYLAESEEKYRLLVDNLNDLIVKVDLEGNLLFVSPSYCWVFGMTEEELLGKQFMPMVHEEDQESTREAMERLMQAPYHVYLEQRAKTKDGWRWFSWSDTAVLDEKGNVKEIIGVGRDISEQKAMQEELIKSKEKAEEGNKLKTAFLNNMSHEIRTPLNAIVGFSSFFQNEKLSPEKRKYYADIVTQSSQQLLDVINDIIMISTITTGQTVFLEKACHINQILQDIYQQALKTNTNTNLKIRLKTPLDADKDVIFSDKTKLNQILTNLVNNAIKFTHRGYVELGYKVLNKAIEFYVTDSGIGINQSAQKIIFEPFRQENDSNEREYGGTGLGLSIAQAYAVLMGGHIRVDSKPGQGATFYFFLPIRQAQQNSKNKLNMQSLMELKEKKVVLIAEDEINNFLLLKELLSRFPVQILHAINGKEAVEAVKNQPEINLVLMDIKMPVMDGYEATRQIKIIRPNLPVIAQTAHAYPEERKKAHDVNCNEYITKPIEVKRFFDCVKKYLL